MVGGGDARRGGNKAEADRLLVTSEKLLASTDFKEAKAFAIRACRSDPTLAEAADSILTICDVLIAREIRLGESKSPDWYAALRLGRLAQNPEHVATQYRRLALLLNPSVNRFPLADQAFKVVSDAWHVLSDPSRKSLYDQEVKLSQLVQPQQQQQQYFKSKPSQSANVAAKQPPRSVAPPATSTVGYPRQSESFWTACPYCFVLFEYPKAYEECVLRCQECRRAFQAVRIQKPPVEEGKGEDVYFSSWSVFPLGFSGEFKAPTSWSPISPLIACSLQKADDEDTTKKRKEPAAPRFFYDDDDIYVAISDDDHEENEPSDRCQDELQANKKVNVGKGKEKLVRRTKKHVAEKAGKGIQHVESVSGASNASYATPVCSSSMSKPMSSRKRTGTGGKNLGRLDLNVEFSNEVEEPAVAGGRNEGNGLGSNREVDHMEGIGFFEDLDEFLSSLPIFSVDGDDKIKAS